MASADVVVIGAGAVGCATAYYLTRLGVKPIVLEKDAIGSHASGFAFGGLTPFTVHGGHGPEYALATAAVKLHHELTEALKSEVGIDTSFELMDYFALAVDESDVTQLKRLLGWLQEHGFNSEWLETRQLLELEPRFSPDLLGAIRSDGAALLEAYRYTLGLGQAAEKFGAEIRHGEVVGLALENGRLAGVQTRSSVIACQQVVLAAGPWCGPASDWLGFDLPIRPLKGQIVRLRLPGSRLEGRFTWRGNYFATKADGMIWAGTTEEEAGFDESITEAARDAILLPLADLFPALLDAEVIQQTACLRPFSADGLPIVGPAPAPDGLWIATGGGRRGILFSTIMGKAIADLVVNGRTEVDLSAFSIERFARPVAAGA